MRAMATHEKNEKGRGRSVGWPDLIFSGRIFILLEFGEGQRR
jgi:hypothetical protein